MKGFMNTFKKKKSEKKSSKVEAPPKNTSNASLVVFFNSYRAVPQRVRNHSLCSFFEPLKKPSWNNNISNKLIRRDILSSCEFELWHRKISYYSWNNNHFHFHTLVYNLYSHKGLFLFHSSYLFAVNTLLAYACHTPNNWLLLFVDRGRSCFVPN